jgi:GTP-binding protein YchF
MAGLSCGIVGLPNVGKSTLFNALTRAGAAVANYPFTTIDPNIGVVPVRDPRLDRLAGIVGVGRIIYGTVEYVDVAGLVRGASKGEGRGNQFLDNVRNCDALVHVVRCFENPDVSHVSSRVDPADDIRTINLELILADLDSADKSRGRLGKRVRNEPETKPVVEALEKAVHHLGQEKPVRSLAVSEPEAALLRPFRFLTAKPVLYVANIDENAVPDGEPGRMEAIRAVAQEEGSAVVPICARIEEEIGQLSEAEAAPFLESLGLKEPGLQRVVRATFQSLGLISFFTFNDEETRAWTVRRGATARDAAGAIHTDFAAHFIRAEVTAFDDFARAGGERGAREKALTRIEGKEYVVKDGDVIYFRVGA